MTNATSCTGTSWVYHFSNSGHQSSSPAVTTVQYRISPNSPVLMSASPRFSCYTLPIPCPRLPTTRPPQHDPYPHSSVPATLRFPFGCTFACQHYATFQNPCLERTGLDVPALFGGDDCIRYPGTWAFLGEGVRCSPRFFWPPTWPSMLPCPLFPLGPPCRDSVSADTVVIAIVVRAHE